MVPYDEGVTVVLKVSVPPSARTGTWELLVDIRSFNSNGSVYQSEECVFTVTVE